jgi:hypothetical protein
MHACECVLRVYDPLSLMCARVCVHVMTHTHTHVYTCACTYAISGMYFAVQMFLRSTKKAELELIAEHAASDVCAEESTSGDGDACGGDSGASKMKDD